MGKYLLYLALTALGWWLHKGQPAHWSSVIWFVGVALYVLAGFVSIAGTLFLAFDRKAFRNLFG